MEEYTNNTTWANVTQNINITYRFPTSRHQLVKDRHRRTRAKGGPRKDSNL